MQSAWVRRAWTDGSALREALWIRKSFQVANGPPRPSCKASLPGHTPAAGGSQRAAAHPWSKAPVPCLQQATGSSGGESSDSGSGSSSPASLQWPAWLRWWRGDWRFDSCGLPALFPLPISLPDGPLCLYYFLPTAPTCGHNQRHACLSRRHEGAAHAGRQLLLRVEQRAIHVADYELQLAAPAGKLLCC